MKKALIGIDKNMQIQAATSPKCPDAFQEMKKWARRGLIIALSTDEYVRQHFGDAIDLNDVTVIYGEPEGTQ
jgi:hypothetical protein